MPNTHYILCRVLGIYTVFGGGWAMNCLTDLLLFRLICIILVCKRDNLLFRALELGRYVGCCPRVSCRVDLSSTRPCLGVTNPVFQLI